MTESELKSLVERSWNQAGGYDDFFLNYVQGKIVDILEDNARKNLEQE